MVGILLFIASISIVPIYFFGIVFLYELACRRTVIYNNLIANRTFFFSIIGIVVLCLFNSLIHGAEKLPNFILLPITVLISFGIRREDLRYFLILMVFEAVVGCVEQIVGVSSFLPSSDVIDFSEEELLYFRKAAGLSNGPATFSVKLLIALFSLSILSDDITKKNKLRYGTILVLGIISSFTRTVVLLGVIYLILKLVINNKNFLFSTIKGKLLVVSICVLIGVFYIGIYDTLLFQLARGEDTVDISGRDVVWERFFVFIENNFWFGNGSYHYNVPYEVGGTAHAHNSFIQLLADNGIIITTLFMANIILKIKKRNIIYIVFFFLTGIAQYVIFWAYSIADVFFYALLCNNLIWKKQLR